MTQSGVPYRGVVAVGEPAGGRADADRPSVARVYDFLLGGHHNFAADRELARRIIQLGPYMPAAARANRDFLGRTVRYLLRQGVRQFLDIGAGIPTRCNVHQIAHATDPAARVVYVDQDAGAVRHGRVMLRDEPQATVIEADLRRPAEILSDPAVTGLLDFTRPVGVLLLATLHFIPEEDDPHGVVARLRDALVPGSHLVVSHVTDETDTERAEVVRKLFAAASAALVPRRRAAISAFFDGFTLIAPGVVPVSAWRPHTAAAGRLRHALYGGVGRLD